MGEAEDMVHRRLSAAEGARRRESQRQFQEANEQFRALLPRALENLRRRDYDVCPMMRKFIDVDGETRVAWRVDSTRRDGEGSEWYLLADGTIVRDNEVVDTIPSISAVGALQVISAYPDQYRERRSFGRWARDWLQAQGIIR